MDLEPGTNRPREPHRSLAYLIKSKMDVEIDPDRLRDFIQLHWSAVQILAHAIHAEKPRDAAAS